MATGCTFGIPWPEYNAGLLYHDTISTRDQSKTLLEFYCSRHKQSASAEGWVQRISNGQISVDGVVASGPDLILEAGAGLEYHRLRWREPTAPHLLQVLHEDKHLLALNKPAGLQVLPSGLFQQRTVLTQLQWRDSGFQEADKLYTGNLNSDANGSCSTDQASEKSQGANPHSDANGSACSSPSPEQASGEYSQAAANPNPDYANGSCSTSPVHRLGRGTSGVLLCAKTPLAKSRLAAHLAEGTERATTRGRRAESRPKKQNLLAGGTDNDRRRFSKTYRALASGIIEQDEITIDQLIERVPYAGVAGGLYMASEKGKPSFSKVVVLWRNEVENCTLVQVQILTGRPHQIRIHLASIGHPLVGDPLYVSGGRPSESIEGILAEGDLQEISPLADDGGYSRPSTALPGDVGYLLHAWRLEFYHPISEEKMLVIAPPPLELQVSGEEGNGRDCS